MEISLAPTPAVQIKPVPRRVYDEELDDVRAILMDLCEELAAQGAVQFRVAGFGDPDWPIDVEVDLSVLMEHVPAAIFSLGRRVQRHLSFKHDGSSYRILCTSSTAWRPSSTEEGMSCKDIEQMLVEVKHEFLRLAEAVSPGVTSHPWMVDWSDRLSQ